MLERRNWIWFETFSSFRTLSSLNPWTEFYCSYVHFQIFFAMWYFVPWTPISNLNPPEGTHINSNLYKRTLKIWANTGVRLNGNRFSKDSSLKYSALRMRSPQQIFPSRLFSHMFCMEDLIARSRLK